MNAKRHLLIVGGLLGVSCLVQVAVTGRSATTSLDAVRFVAMARSIGQQGLLETVRTHRQQPLYPAWLWAVDSGLRAATVKIPSSLATIAQLAAAVPLVLAVVPLYLLFLRLVGPAAAAAGSLLFCLLPEVSRLGADAISDSTHLLFACIAFWAMVEYLQRRGPEVAGRGEGSGGRIWPPLWLLLAGLSTSVATLARVEVLVLAAALGLTMAVFQFTPRRRQPGGRLAAAAACFLLGLAVVWAPYLAATGALTPQTAVARILGRHQVEQPISSPDDPGAAEPAAVWLLPDGEPASFDARDPAASSRQRGYAAALVRFGRKLARATGYWIGLLALWGAWRLPRIRAGFAQDGRRTDRAAAGDRFVHVFFVLFSLIAIRFTAVEGYLECRHLLLLVVPAMGAAGYGALELGTSLARRSRRHPAGYSAAAWVVVAAAGVSCLPQAFARLHYNHVGHRWTAQWLAGQGNPSGKVLDTRGWTGLYSGRQTYLYEDARTALVDPHLAYLVLENWELECESRRSRTLRWLVDSAAEPVAEFPEPAACRPDQRPVAVFRWHPDRFLRQMPRQTAGGPSDLASGGSTLSRGETGIAASAAPDVHSLRFGLPAAGMQ